MEFVFLLDDEIPTTVRKVYTFFDGLGATGGLYNVLSGFFSLIASAVNREFFFGSLLGRLFLFSSKSSKKRRKVRKSPATNVNYRA